MKNRQAKADETRRAKEAEAEKSKARLTRETIMKRIKEA
jgi:hypothetical protein